MGDCIANLSVGHQQDQAFDYHAPDNDRQHDANGRDDANALQRFHDPLADIRICGIPDRNRKQREKRGQAEPFSDSGRQQSNQHICRPPGKKHAIGKEGTHGLDEHRIDNHILKSWLGLNCWPECREKRTMLTNVKTAARTDYFDRDKLIRLISLQRKKRLSVRAQAACKATFGAQAVPRLSWIYSVVAGLQVLLAAYSDLFLGPCRSGDLSTSRGVN
jgi:hypothetical protein